MFNTIRNDEVRIKACLCLTRWATHKGMFMFNTVCNGGLHIKECLCLTQFVMVDYT